MTMSENERKLRDDLDQQIVAGRIAGYTIDRVNDEANTADVTIIPIPALRELKLDGDPYQWILEHTK